MVSWFWVAWFPKQGLRKAGKVFALPFKERKKLGSICGEVREQISFAVGFFSLPFLLSGIKRSLHIPLPHAVLNFSPFLNT